MKQIGIAFLQYEQDNDEWAPYGSGAYEGESWAYCIYPYVKTTGAFACPDDTTQVITDSHVTGDNICSYAFNSQMTYTPTTSFTSPANTVQLIEISGVQIDLAGAQPCYGWQSTWGYEEDYTCISGTRAGQRSPGTNGVWLYDNKFTNDGSAFATGYMGGRGVGANTYGQFPNPLGRHNNGANYLMADGHVKWLMGNSVSSGYAALGPACNQEDSPHIGGCYNGSGKAAGTANSSFAVTFSYI